MYKVSFSIEKPEGIISIVGNEYITGITNQLLDA